ncbi:hypothetical protein GEMRC1_001490 [Eukaryota sp. GEM-RC1]
MISPVRLPSATLPPPSTSSLSSHQRSSSQPSKSRFNSPSSQTSAPASVLQGTISKLKESNRILLNDLQREREQFRISHDSPQTVAAVRKKYEQVVFSVRSQLDSAKAQVTSFQKQISQLETDKLDLRRQLDSSRQAESKSRLRIAKLEHVLNRARTTLGTTMTSNELLNQIKLDLEDEQIGLLAESNKYAELAHLRGLEVQKLKAENQGLRKQLEAANSEMALQTQQFLREKDSWNLEVSELRRHVHGDSVISELRIGSESKRKGLSTLIKNLQDKGKNQSSMLEDFLGRVMGEDLDSGLMDYISELLSEQKSLKISLAQSRKELTQLKGGSLESGCVRSVSLHLEEKLAEVEEQLKEVSLERDRLLKRMNGYSHAVESIHARLLNFLGMDNSLQESNAPADQILNDLDAKLTVILSSTSAQNKRSKIISSLQSNLIRRPSTSSRNVTPTEVASAAMNLPSADLYDGDGPLERSQLKSLSLAFIKKKEGEKR